MATRTIVKPSRLGDRRYLQFGVAGEAPRNRQSKSRSRRNAHGGADHRRASLGELEHGVAYLEPTEIWEL